MAPFKLKFRMGNSSRSTSQEIEEPVQQPLLVRQSAIAASNTTIDSEYNSMSSTTNDQHNLLPNTFDEEIGYENPAIMRTKTNIRYYQNIRNSPTSSTSNEDNNQCSKYCNEQNEENSSASAGDLRSRHSGCSIGAQIFLSNPILSNENLMDSTAGSCDPLFDGQSLEQINLEDTDDLSDDNDAGDSSPDLSAINIDSDEDWKEQEKARIQATLDTIINNKSSKKIYKAVAKEWGITCKMSEQCRCMDCQSNYFDCEYEENEHQKSDGGLGAGTPAFINEVMQGSACTII